MENKLPSLKLSLIGVIGILAILLVGILVFKVDVIILLALSLIYTGMIARFNGVKQEEIIEGMAKGCSKGFVGLLFFLLIGAIIGSWVQAGTVPALVYYGLNLLNPKFFLVTSFIICSIVSMIIGTSWGTVATVGISILGVAMSSGITIPLPIIAGSIISGAWFGDKMSPVSDSTVITSAAADANVYDHIKVMAMTTMPSYIISLIIYSMINLKYANQVVMNNQNIQLIQSTIEKHYDVGFFVFIPVIVLVILCFFKVPAVSSLLIVIGLGSVCSIMVQGNSVMESLNAIMQGVSIDTGVEAVNTLVNRGGIIAMLPTFLLGFMALSVGGVLERVGFLQVIIEKVAGKIKSVFSLVVMTMLTCIMANAIFSDVYLTIVLNANIYKKIYKDRGLAATMLSRTISEGTTMSTPLIPWTAASAFIVGTLGISTLEYAPYAILNIINPVLSLVFTGLGIFVIKNRKDYKNN